MDSLSYLFLKRIEKVRSEIQSSLGFQPLFADMLDDGHALMAVQFPESIYLSSLSNSLRDYIIDIFADNELECYSGTYKQKENYNVAFCGSRFTTLILYHVWEFYVSIRLNPIHEGLTRSIPKVPTWSIIELSYDNIKPEDKKYIGYHTYEYKAVLDSENKEKVMKSMKADILARMQ